ncbi:MAG: HAD family hydrolase [Nitrospira sp.]|nr:MAG: HAD family hydrolase [Nitrospira sp.]
MLGPSKKYIYTPTTSTEERSLPVSPSSPANRAVAAFFDVDNTLIPGSAVEVRFFRFLWSHGLVGPRAVLRSIGHVLRHAPPLSVHPLRERKLYLEGLRRSEVEPLARRFVRDNVIPHLSSAATQSVQRHREAGHAVVFLTGSLDFLMAPLARHLLVDQVFAATPEHENDRYTGRLVTPLPYGTGKRDVVHRLAVELGLDLSSSYAYGDSPGDVETLQAIGHPQVVNPIRGMARIAQHRGWPVVKWD